MKDYEVYIYGLFADDSPERIRYIGQTKNNPSVRLNGHKHKARGGKVTSPVYDWIRKHEYNISFRVIIETDSREELNSLEQQLIREYKALGLADLNVRSGGHAGTDEFLEKLRLGVKKRPPLSAEGRLAVSRRMREYFKNHPELKPAMRERAYKYIAGRNKGSEELEKLRQGNQGVNSPSYRETVRLLGQIDFSTLSDKRRRIAERYLEGVPVWQIGEEFGIHRANVSREMSIVLGRRKEYIRKTPQVRKNK